jgi:phosphatidylserine/phosphatidylglycerophosphate/cardiolipin synthase-like enzyme
LVYTGAMNFTTQQIYTHYNNMVLVRDQPLAMAYTIEFEEMWGGDGALPDPMLARFGTHKLDNTPKLFKPAGELVELYFSPSDNTNAAILGTLEEAQQDVLFALLTFTRGDLAASVAEGHQQGIDVRGIINNVNDNGSQYNFLLSQGVPVKHHSPSRIFHHKYAVVDQHKVITGSHNWSNAANNINDENTLIFHSPDIANIFRQEFEARWAELPDLTQVSTTWPTSLHIHALVQHDGMIQVLVESDIDRNTVWQLHDMQGRAFATLTQGLQSGQQWLQIPVYFASPGMFVLTARGEDGIFAVSRLSIVR